MVYKLSLENKDNTSVEEKSNGEPSRINVYSERLMCHM